jgi:hypothetical protein
VGVLEQGDGAADGAVPRSNYVGANSFAKYREGLEVRTPSTNGIGKAGRVGWIVTSSHILTFLSLFFYISS